ncbi:MAG: metallopeptidase [Erysipelotrichaceae bacterium]|nr:metallopeptidase [Erysipelotrichaceae bacterium]
MDEELIEISEEIFREVISRLTLHLRFMDIALNRYVFAADATEFRCDGRVFHYAPIALIRMFRSDPRKVTRGYLHIVLHSVFQHQFFAENRKPSLWNLASDIAVEEVIRQLGLDCTKKDDDEEMVRILERIHEEVPVFTAAKIYRWLENREMDEVRLMAPLFHFDEHDIWYVLRNVRGSRDMLFGEENRDDFAAEGNNIFEGASHDTGESEEKEDPDQKDAEIRQIRNTLQDWKEISEKIEMDLELFQKEHGDRTDALIQSLSALRREKYDYSQFLKRFMQSGEKMQINDDEFDMIFYTYGLRLYENLPLIEPLEFRETENVRELVIAIDTSGSVQGEVVQSFLQKTYNMFQQRENFFSRFRIHIIQCDMVIRDIRIIGTARQFEEYIHSVEIKGLGGTDFRPVFNYVDEEIKNHRFRKLGGLLYFTDGDGVYPKHKPSYKTAFLFTSDEKNTSVPPWAIKYILEGEE